MQLILIAHINEVCMTFLNMYSHLPYYYYSTILD